MNQWKPASMKLRTANSINAAMSSRCDVCGKHRGGARPVSHAKCAETRRQRG